MVRRFLILNKHRMPEVKNTFIGLKNQLNVTLYTFFAQIPVQIHSIQIGIYKEVGENEKSLFHNLQRIFISGLLLPQLGWAGSPFHPVRKQ